MTCLVAYPDGKRVATCGPGDAVSVWDVATGQLVAQRRLGKVNAISVARDGGALFAYESVQRLEGRAAGWLLTGDLSRVIRLEHDGDLSEATFSPDGARLATLSFDGNARIWSREGALEATLPHAGPVAHAAWSSDGSWLATGTFAGTLTVWERSGWRARKAIEAHTNYIAALAVDGGDTLIASAAGDEARQGLGRGDAPAGCQDSDRRGGDSARVRSGPAPGLGTIRHPGLALRSLERVRAGEVAAREASGRDRCSTGPEQRAARCRRGPPTARRPGARERWSW